MAPFLQAPWRSGPNILFPALHVVSKPNKGMEKGYV